jgi:hypothetical protein
VLIERPAPQVVVLDVGGSRYKTKCSTLLACGAGSKLFAMFEGLAQGGEATECPPEGIPGEVRAPLPRGADGAYFIDRNGRLFEYVLDYLRDYDPVDAQAEPEGEVALAKEAAHAEISLPSSLEDLQQLAKDAGFYGLPGLAAACSHQQAIEACRRDPTPLDRMVPCRDLWGLGLTSGTNRVDQDGDIQVQFAAPYAAPPVVLLSGEGNDNHSIACLLPGTVTTEGFSCRLIQCSSGSWERGAIHWTVVDHTSLPRSYTDVQAGILSVTLNADFQIRFPQSFNDSVPVIQLTGEGNSRHSVACVLPGTVTPEGFKCRLITASGGWEHGKIHWTAMHPEIPQGGTLELNANGDVHVPFVPPFANVPIIQLTGQGKRQHSTACIVAGSVTTEGFVCRLIHRDRGWEHGTIHWVAHSGS